MTAIQDREKAFRAPTVFRSALFPVLYLVAIGLVVLGGVFGLSSKEARAFASIRILSLNIIIIAALLFYLGWRVWRVLFVNRSGVSAPQLHRRFVLIFSLSALIPAVAIGIFAYSLIQKNINDVFGDSVRSTMENSMRLSDDFVDYRIQELEAEVDALELDMTRARFRFDNRISFTEYLINQAVYRDLAAIYLIDQNGAVLAKAESGIAPPYAVPGLRPMQYAIDGKRTITNRNAENLLIGLKALDAYDGAILYVAEFLENGVLNNIDKIQAVEASMGKYDIDQKRLENVFLLTFFETAMMILISAVWLGLVLANRIVRPLGQIVVAAERVREGDLSARVNLPGVWDEIGDLAGAFNRMTRQLHTQREDLVREHDTSEQRRRFSEAVLSGVSAGVIGIAPEGKITLMNSSAEALLDRKSDEVIGLPLKDTFPAFVPVLKKARESVLRVANDQIDFEIESDTRNLDTRVSAYQGDRNDTGWVITFDDMTRLVSAQRHSAWREVARRIAHEIKNPLTPIQLSAERLQRKYGESIKDNPQVFENCTKTILRQVDTLERMVNEFSAFARMPEPEMVPLDIKETLKSTLFAQGVAFPEIEFKLRDDTRLGTNIVADERLITQALTNIYKNSGEAITRIFDGQGDDVWHGQIQTILTDDNEHIHISIFDNGPGWPMADVSRLLEPYVTTRNEGTGLGLAIVKRIVEDHGGTLDLSERVDGQSGAYVRLSFSRAAPLMKNQRAAE